ncbi:MAG TPA: NAD(P)/FAD-dependent oxidoreductase [Steroidobacteraceae bacterium]|nr:NAD(P)/FAD-dependent oxidoreductase [Steroidobacteraceae bacterium]
MPDAHDLKPGEAAARVLIVGAGFVGLNAAKALGNRPGVEVTVLDRQNHHLFQPLLYQVATAGLSPADIAAPIRSILSHYRNIRVLQGAAQAVDVAARSVATDIGELTYDYLILACGATHAYFGHEEWEASAPGLKSLSQATEIRRRVLSAFEAAEWNTDAACHQRLLTFVIVGAGPTGVELAGAIGEMSRYTLARDFRNIDSRQARVVLVEAGPRVLPTFSADLAQRAQRDLEALGVQVRLSCKVTGVDERGVAMGAESIEAATILWAAGVRASDIGASLGIERDNSGRVPVGPDLTLAGHREVFIAGDLARCKDLGHDRLLPGVAQAAIQEGIYIGHTILGDLQGRARQPFHYHDKGQLATIGHKRAICELGRLHIAGRMAWWLWLVVHIYSLTGFRNRLSVMLQWAWSYFTFGRGARLIVAREWREYGASDERR